VVKAGIAEVKTPQPQRDAGSGVWRAMD